MLYVGMDGIGMGWDWMVIIGHRYSKSTFGANKDRSTFFPPQTGRQGFNPHDERYYVSLPQTGDSQQSIGDKNYFVRSHA